MEEHKQYLSDHADEAERRAAAQVMEGLQGLRLEDKVASVAVERAALYRRIFWQRIVIAMVALAFIAGAAYLLVGRKSTSIAPTPPQLPVEQPQKSPVPRDNQVVPSEKGKDNTGSVPIAQVRPSERLANPRYPAPEITLIRGDQESNKTFQTLLNQLWYTDYPLRGLTSKDPFKQADENLKNRDFNAAYIALNRLENQMAVNDTLRYLKGYCLLEMGEGNEALANFDPLQGRHAAWEPQLQWYRGLAMLLAGERAKALDLFRQVKTLPKHPYRKQAEKAAGLLSK